MHKIIYYTVSARNILSVFFVSGKLCCSILFENSSLRTDASMKHHGVLTVYIHRLGLVASLT